MSLRYPSTASPEQRERAHELARLIDECYREQRALASKLNELRSEQRRLNAEMYRRNP